MPRYRLMQPLWFGFCLAVLAGCTPPNVTSSEAQAPPVGPNVARVWFFRQMADPGLGNVDAGTPIIYANGSPIADIPQGSAFFHDFPPGSIGSRSSLTEPRPANTTPFSWRRESKPTCRSNGKPTGKQTAREEEAALPS